MADGTDDDEVKGVESLKNFERALGHVRNSVRPLTLMSREEVGACVSPADGAKLNLQLAYGMTSLFYMFLRTQGVSPLKHPVKSELDRIRGYFGRLQKVGKPTEQRTLKVDADASRRFINSALSSDSVWKKAQQSHRGPTQTARGPSNDPGIGRSKPAGEPEKPEAGDKFVFVGIPLGKRKHGSGRFWDGKGSKETLDEDKKTRPDYADGESSKRPKRGTKKGSRYH